jgi:hypothetical protein
MDLKDLKIDTGWCTLYFTENSIIITARLDLNDHKRRLTQLVVDSTQIDLASKGAHIRINKL